MLRPSFVPPAEIRVLRDYTRLRTDLTVERTRHWQRLEKLLKDALIKITTVASRIDGVSVRQMIEALIAGQRDPRVLVGFARGRMRMKHAAPVEALTGRFDDHHGELACGPSGYPLWVSDVRPGSSHDLTAARETVLPALYPYAARGLPVLAGKGYTGDGLGIHVPIKRQPDGPLHTDNRCYN